MYKKEFLPFEEARAFVRSLKLKNKAEWIAYRKSGKKPASIPADPAISYKNQGWTFWGDFLGKGGRYNKKKMFLSFQQARAYARSLQLKSYRQWLDHCHKGHKPDNIPASPEDYYQESWKGWRDWLGHDKLEFLPFQQARQYVRSLKLNSYLEWIQYKGSGKLPKNIPLNPERVYKNKGWISTPDWLGYA